MTKAIYTEVMDEKEIQFEVVKYLTIGDSVSLAKRKVQVMFKLKSRAIDLAIKNSRVISEYVYRTKRRGKFDGF